MKRDSSELCLEGEFCCISTDCLNSLWYNEIFFWRGSECRSRLFVAHHANVLNNSGTMNLSVGSTDRIAS